MRVVVCDDTEMEAEFLCDMLEEYDRAYAPLTVVRYRSAEQLLEAEPAGEGAALYLLDIVLPGMDGLELARTLRRGGDSAPIAFLTNSGEHREEALTIHGGEYLTKPPRKAELFHLLADCARAAERREDPLVLDTLEGGRAVRAGDLIAVAADGDALVFRLTGGREWRGANNREQFAALCDSLQKGGGFFKTNRNTLINAAHITKLERACFRMSEGLTFAIPRLRYGALAQKYLDYLARLGGAPGR